MSAIGGQSRIVANNPNPMPQRREVARFRCDRNVNTHADDVTVPSFGPKMVCTGCRMLGADVWPNWQK